MPGPTPISAVPSGPPTGVEEAATPPTVVRVEPLLTTRAVRGPFDYRLTPELAGTDVGSLLVVPFGRQKVLGVVTALARSSDVPDERLLAPRERLDATIPPALVRLAEAIAAEYASTPARALMLMLPPGIGAGGTVRVREREEVVVSITPAGTAALAGGRRLGPRQKAALQALADAAPEPLHGPSVADSGTLRRLADRGLIERATRRVDRRPEISAIGPRHATAPPLTGEQQAALDAIVARLGRGRLRAVPDGGDAAFLLHGVTGSGKTEVYLGAAAEALRRGMGAIVLVPEIALTPQTVGRFRHRFGDTVAILHSQLSTGERRDEWHRLRRGDARICVGPRSAIFAPIEDLGLIVVDEEHDASYKHEGDPRYDARMVALRRAQREGAVLVAGSATPRPESRHDMRRLALTRRVDERPLPGVELLDLRGAGHPLHPTTREALEDVRRTGGKGIVLLNRRGWSNFLTCQTCGRTWMCPDCDVALVLHRAESGLACHHCGHWERVPRACPDCGSVSIGRHGAGTERIEAELADALGGPDFPVVRLDADTAARRGALSKLLRRFESAPSGLLIGTQMVAKGHDFPDVTLGVVIDADSTLRFPDFRAEERTFALVAQLAGRVGRGPRGGRVLVQSLAPDAPVLRHAAQHDSEAFLAEELERRQALRYPPFATLVRIVFASEEPGAAAVAAGALRDRLAIPGAMVLGPAALFRLRGRDRSQIVVKAPERMAAAAAVASAVDEIAGTPVVRGVAVSVDVDPQ